VNWRRGQIMNNEIENVEEHIDSLRAWINSPIAFSAIGNWKEQQEGDK
jgi:hypothetical protein